MLLQEITGASHQVIVPVEMERDPPVILQKHLQHHAAWFLLLTWQAACSAQTTEGLEKTHSNLEGRCWVVSQLLRDSWTQHHWSHPLDIAQSTGYFDGSLS